MTAPTQDATQMPPHSRDAERALLGSIFRDSFIIDEALATIQADDFYVFAHQLIFRSVSELAAKGKEIDLATVGEWLLKKKLMDEIGAPYLAELWDAAPSASHWRRYCEIILDRSIRRSLIHTGADLSSDPFNLNTEPSELVASAERRIGDIAERGIKSETVDLQSALREAYDRIDRRRGQSGELSGIPTGFTDLDSLLCGFQDSELIIVGARPSVGKTALAINVVRHAAMDCSIPTLFVSLEQSRVEVSERLLCMEGRIDSHKMRRGHFSVQDESDLMDAGDRLGKSPLWIDDVSVQSMTHISANARRLKRKKGIKFVLIDYLQLIEPDYRSGANRQEQVASISRRLKQLARDLKVPVVALCQVNRGPEDRQNKEPKLSDLRESGAIEADADTVLLMHRTAEFGTTSEIEIIVAKQRNGPTGQAKLLFSKPFMRFENMAYQASAAG